MLNEINHFTIILVNFYLFQCNITQFTCDSGECIDVGRRCNDIKDCKDSSDENDCQNIDFDHKSYRKKIPPNANDATRTNVEVNLSIIFINRINELHMQFSSRVMIRIKWRDPRLHFHDLFEGSTILDEKEVNSIWKPPLFLSNSLELLSLVENKFLQVQVLRQNKGKLKSEKELHEGMIYDGNENDLMMTAKFETEFTCSYQLHSYPFDSQICFIELTAPIHKDINLVPGKIEFNGNRETTPQFQIHIGTLKQEMNGSRIQGLIHLKRIPTYHILSTYLPTCCILLMAIITLYIDESHFDSTIMVTLTSMLVMYTLFQSISDSMPPTAYLKLLDVWFIFGLIMPFIIFIVEVAWELLQQKENNDVIHLYLASNSIKTKCKIISQIGIPALFLAFATVYIIVVSSKYC